MSFADVDNYHKKFPTAKVRAKAEVDPLTPDVLGNLELPCDPDGEHEKVLVYADDRKEVPIGDRQKRGLAEVWFGACK